MDKTFSNFLAVLFASIVLTSASVSTLGQTLNNAPVAEDWAAFFPEIDGCVKQPEAALAEQIKPSVFTVQYLRAIESRPGEIPLAPWSECGFAQIVVTGPEPKKSITKKQLREQRLLEKTSAKSRKQSGKEPRFYPAAPHPRSFTINGYEAIEYFPAHCDTVGCQMYQRNTIIVRFAQNRKITIAFDPMKHPERILGGIDFENLNASLTSWLEQRKAPKEK